MPTQKRLEIIVGLVVAIGIVLLLALTLKLGSFSLFQKTDNYIVLFANTSGLEVGSDVKQGGVKIGRISNIRINHDQDPPIEVRVSLAEGTILRKDSKAYIFESGLLGESYIELSLGTTEAEVLPILGSIEGELPAKMAQLFQKGAEIGEQVSEVLDHVNNIVADIDSDEMVKETLTALREATQTINILVQQNQGAVGTGLQNFGEASGQFRDSMVALNELAEKLNMIIDRNTEPISNTIGNAETATETINKHLDDVMVSMKELLQRIDKLIEQNDDNISKTLKNTADATESLDQSAKELELTLAKINSGEGTIGKLIHDDKLYENATEATGAAKDWFSKSMFSYKIQTEYELFYHANIDRIRNDMGIRLVTPNQRWVFVGINDIGEADSLTATIGKPWGPFRFNLGAFEDDFINLGARGLALNEDEPVLNFYFRMRLFDSLIFMVSGVEDVTDESKYYGGLRIYYK
jgi:ABC-type transporter Mla subunit MlaD